MGVPAYPTPMMFSLIRQNQLLQRHSWIEASEPLLPLTVGAHLPLQCCNNAVSGHRSQPAKRAQALPHPPVDSIIPPPALPTPLNGSPLGWSLTERAMQILLRRHLPKLVNMVWKVSSPVVNNMLCSVRYTTRLFSSHRYYC